MDLIRIFIDTGFSKVAERFLSEEKKPSVGSDGFASFKEGHVIDENLFVEECRRHHPELSDDQIRMIYYLYQDEWAYLPEDVERMEFSEKESAEVHPNIFNVLCRFTHDILRYNNGEPLVRFRHLFRWREVSLNIGEDLLVSAFLAYRNMNDPHVNMNEVDCYLRDTVVDGMNFGSWPTILHNDNPNLRYIFEKLGLWELHSHLNASADNFTLSWVSLMTRIEGRSSQFEKLAKHQDPSRKRMISQRMYGLVSYAAYLRMRIWKMINGRGIDHEISLDKCLSKPETSAKDTQILIAGELRGHRPLDYVPHDITSPMRVVGGERKFLYCALQRILLSDDISLTRMLYRYVLIKNEMRRFMVQINDNRGFANFKRHQDLKTSFMTERYRSLLPGMAIWEASVFNYTRVFETRIAPLKKIGDIGHLGKYCREISNFFEAGEEPEWSLIFHFLKHPDNFQADAVGEGGVDEETPIRDSSLRKDIRTQSVVLRHLLKMEEWQRAEYSFTQRFKGIDAASSEIGCRPEIFAQAFRYLKAAGYAATFHVGEDFYDLADGLRAIDEAITFLGLEAGDRLGHALALGVDASDFYAERHNYIALPIQWMLDNVVWLYFKSREYNVAIEPSTEDFLLITFRSLVRRIGYETKKGNEKIEIVDYYQSMLLRGDNPRIFSSGGDPMRSPSSNGWRHYERHKSKLAEEIRQHNGQARELLKVYHENKTVIRKGLRIASFSVPSGYSTLIGQIQERMMRDISKRQLGIECCPSSNYRIGYIKRYEKHPIFRFMPVKLERTHYPLAVTVNTDDLGVFSTSLPNEYSLLALALMKMKDCNGDPMYSSQEIYDWVERIVKNGEKYAFRRSRLPYPDLGMEEERY